MTKKKESKPELIEDKDLDEASGGLLPAVQKVREAAATSGPTETTSSSHTGGVNVALADGSVRFIKD